MRRPSATRLSHATAGSTRTLPAMPIKTRAAGDGHVTGSSRRPTRAHPPRRRDHPRTVLGTVTSPAHTVSVPADAGRPWNPVSGWSPKHKPTRSDRRQQKRSHVDRGPKRSPVYRRLQGSGLDRQTRRDAYASARRSRPGRGPGAAPGRTNPIVRRGDWQGRPGDSDVANAIASARHPPGRRDRAAETLPRNACEALSPKGAASHGTDVRAKPAGLASRPGEPNVAEPDIVSADGCCPGRRLLLTRLRSGSSVRRPPPSTRADSAPRSDRVWRMADEPAAARSSRRRAA